MTQIVPEEGMGGKCVELWKSEEERNEGQRREAGSVDWLSPARA